MSILSQTDSLFFGADIGLSHAKAQSIVDAALLGADDGELFLESIESESMVWDDGKLRSAAYDASQGFGLRVACGETVGFAHSSVLDEGALRRAATNLAAVKGGYAGTLALAPQKRERCLYSDGNPLFSKTFEERLSLLQSIDAYVRHRDSRVHQVSVSLAATWQAVRIMGPKGFAAADIRPLVRLNVSVVALQGDRMEHGSYGAGGRVSYDFLFNPVQWKLMADEALRKAVTNLEATEAHAGEMTVVVGAGWPAILLHEAIGHGLEGDFNRKKASAFSGLMGQRVAAKGVTIVDDGTLENKRGSIAIDDEGTPTQRTTLIEDGVLVGYMQDRLNARLMGTTSTGNGRRESFACQPYPRMTNTMMLAGSCSPEEIIASVDRGLYAVDFGGGQVDITSGKFVFSTTEAYQIEGGKIGRPVKGASLVGTGFETLKRIAMIGSDCRIDSGVGTCGKNGQSVPVGVAQPTLRLDGMTVGGAEV